MAQLDEQERTILDAYTADLYVATTAQLDLQGMTSMGYDGDHELVVGGYKQASAGAGVGRDAASPPACSAHRGRLGCVGGCAAALPANPALPDRNRAAHAGG